MSFPGSILERKSGPLYCVPIPPTEPIITSKIILVDAPTINSDSASGINMSVFIGCVQPVPSAICLIWMQDGEGCHVS